MCFSLTPHAGAMQRKPPPYSTHPPPTCPWYSSRVLPSCAWLASMAASVALVCSSSSARTWGRQGSQSGQGSRSQVRAPPAGLCTQQLLPRTLHLALPCPALPHRPTSRASAASHLARAPQSARHILSKRRSIRLGLRAPLAQARLATRQQLPPLLCCRLESGGALIDSRLPEGRLDASILSLVLCKQCCQRALLLFLAAQRGGARNRSSHQAAATWLQKCALQRLAAKPPVATATRSQTRELQPSSLTPRPPPPPAPDRESGRGCGPAGPGCQPTAWPPEAVFDRAEEEHCGLIIRPCKPLGKQQASAAWGCSPKHALN